MQKRGRGRPPKFGSKKEDQVFVTTISFPLRTWRAIQAAAKAQGLPVRDLIREAVQAYLERKE